MLDLGTPAPDFSLPDTVSEQTVSLADFSGKPLLVAFICNHCPYVVLIKDEFARFAREYQAKGLDIVAISANDVDNYPQDGPDNMREFAEANGFAFPYLYDASQTVAKAYHAACTPDFFMFDSTGKLYYRGQFDNARPGSGSSVTGQDMRSAADALLNGEAPPERQIASLGCNIKWKPGNEPTYYGQ
jgi:peroxiredoxin